MARFEGPSRTSLRSRRTTSPSREQVLRQFLTQYYGAQFELPDRIYIAAPRPAGIDGTLDELFGPRGVEVHFRPTGRYASLGRLAERLARATVDQVVARPAPREVLLAVQSLLELPTIPNWIEGVDISIFQGSEAVGSVRRLRAGPREALRVHVAIGSARSKGPTTSRW